MSERPESTAQDDASAIPEPPATFGKYRLLRRIGRGGMAEVFLARPKGQRRLLAIKCMRKSLASRPAFLEMFIREGKLAMQLHHDGIVKAFEIGRVHGIPFICMEYISGVDLSQLIPRIHTHYLRRVPVPHALYIVSQVCEGLEYAHALRDGDGRSLKLVNRDVNPSNIRISFDGKVKLLDFGIAKASTALSSEIGAIKGKIGHMSPEQVRGLPVDSRSDIFSVGVTLHEMLTGERLFKGSSDFQTMDRVRRAEVAPPSRANPRVPEDLDAVVLRMLDRSAEQRYQTAGEAGEALRQVLARFRFSSTELRDLVRELFHAEWQQDEALIAASKFTEEHEVVPRRTAADEDYGEFVVALDGAEGKRSSLPPRPRRRVAWWLYGLVAASLVVVLAAVAFVLFRR
ncbi:MAG: serine/threonine protein kinase [Proteobacteria bacterium]|nr:serine/threonine protein kinase [Pseudomonadota bacterium]